MHDTLCTLSFTHTHICYLPDTAAWVVGGVRTISCPSLAAPYTSIPGTPRASPQQMYQVTRLGLWIYYIRQKR